MHTEKVDLMNSLLNYDMNIFKNTAQKKVHFMQNDTIHNLINTAFNSETHQMNIGDMCFRIECSSHQIMNCIILHKNALFFVLCFQVYSYHNSVRLFTKWTFSLTVLKKLFN